ncbi:ketopantoate reductase PanE/ApbA C terminal-domain-containing protein [Scheffersomyces xylosifermentans]|uniref:ketopantoate reductase PanE/ApbA C terminal-domain-containing protein n=1 Tax=Scheffersomyces xylosifermentans TaxID=1304137 RepID=UPI00315D643A
MTTKVLSIGLGGVGAIVAYTLCRNNPTDLELTAVIRSDYDVVTSKGYTISSVDYGGRRENGDPKESENAIKGFKPHNVVKSLEQVESGPFDYIVVSTKVIPSTAGNNVWDQVEANKAKLLKPNSATSIVLIQNGIDIEQYWKNLQKEAFLISGVSYISSTNSKGTITQYSHDSLLLGLFDITMVHDQLAIAALEKFNILYSNDINSTKLDHNSRFTRWKKLLYNATYNTVCALTDLDVGQLYELKDSVHVIDEVIFPMMKEVQKIANIDLHKYDYGSYEQYIDDEHVTKMIKLTELYDAPQNYQPSMLVDARSGRLIELDIILGNIIKSYKKNSEDGGKKIVQEIPYLNLLFYLLSMVQHRLKSTTK